LLIMLFSLEISHHMKCKVNGKVGELALKIDINKAFDQVDWNYLLSVMIKMGFHKKWVDYIKLCLEFVQYLVMVNGDFIGPISLGRGLRQGNPLLSYLFIIYTESLSCLLKKYESKGELHGIKVCIGAPTLSHLLFADNCFLFCRANKEESTILKSILDSCG